MTRSLQGLAILRCRNGLVSTDEVTVWLKAEGNSRFAHPRDATRSGPIIGATVAPHSTQLGSSPQPRTFYSIHYLFLLPPQINLSNSAKVYYCAEPQDSDLLARFISMFFMHYLCFVGSILSDSGPPSQAVWRVLMHTVLFLSRSIFVMTMTSFKGHHTSCRDDCLHHHPPHHASNTRSPNLTELLHYFLKKQRASWFLQELHQAVRCCPTGTLSSFESPAQISLVRHDNFASIGPALQCLGCEPFQGSCRYIASLFAI